MKRNVLTAITGALFLSGMGSSMGPDPFGPVVKKKDDRPDDTEDVGQPDFSEAMPKTPKRPNLFNAPDWVFFQEIDLNDTAIRRIRIDTRDYHCLVFNEVKPNQYPDTHKARKNPKKYYHTNEELTALIERFWTESKYGLESDDHVHLALEGVFRSMHGEMKYTELIRIGNEGWAVCTGDREGTPFMFNKYDLSQPVFYGRRSKR